MIDPSGRLYWPGSCWVCDEPRDVDDLDIADGLCVRCWRLVTATNRLRVVS